MKRASYFSLSEWAIIVSIASGGTLTSTYFPIKSILEHLGITELGAGMALFGGIICVFWISLSCQIVKKKYGGIITSVLIASFSLLIQPWYAEISPIWFSIYAIVRLLCMGAIIEALRFRRSWLAALGGGLGNLACVLITWLSVGSHTGTWVSLGSVPFLALCAIVSGSIGALLAQGITQMIAQQSPTQ